MQTPDALAALGFELMAGADAAIDLFPAERATAFRDGVIIVLLAHRPIRLSNLTAIQCDRHLIRRGEDWHLVFEASEVKGRRALEMTVPSVLHAGLERYLKVYRPILLIKGRQKEAPVTGLWVSRQGTQMGRSAVRYQITNRTKTAFGTSVNPHLFRDCAATEIAISAPQEVAMIKGVLGHTNMATSERHYNQASSLEASRRYTSAIAHLGVRHRTGRIARFVARTANTVRLPWPLRAGRHSFCAVV